MFEFQRVTLRKIEYLCVVWGFFKINLSLVGINIKLCKEYTVESSFQMIIFTRN